MTARLLFVDGTEARAKELAWIVPSLAFELAHLPSGYATAAPDPEQRARDKIDAMVDVTHPCFAEATDLTTLDGKSLGMQLAYRDSTQFISGGSDFDTETLTASFEFGVPLSEFSRFRYGALFQDSSLVTGQFSSTQAISFVQNNGNPETFVEGQVFGTDFRAYELFSGWTRDTRDRVQLQP